MTWALPFYLIAGFAIGVAIAIAKPVLFGNAVLTQKQHIRFYVFVVIAFGSSTLAHMIKDL